jgi:hypothetical protein
MLSQQQIVKYLGDRNPVIVAKATGLSYISINRLLKDPEKGCHVSTLKLLSDYLTMQAEEVLHDELCV